MFNSSVSATRYQLIRGVAILAVVAPIALLSACSSQPKPQPEPEAVQPPPAPAPAPAPAPTPPPARG
jgi:hypothetical protein